MNTIEKRFTYNKSEKLKLENDIEALFSTGKSIFSYPFKLYYQLKPKINNEEVLIKAGVTVSSKKFKKATDRNKIKRLLRELYRLNKYELYTLIPDGYTMNFFVVFIGNELPRLKDLQTKWPNIVTKLAKALKNESA